MFPLENIKKYGLSTWTTIFNADSVGTRAGWSESPDLHVQWVLVQMFSHGCSLVFIVSDTLQKPSCIFCCIILFPIQASQKEMGLGFPCRSYDQLFLYISTPTNYDLNHLNRHQTQPASSHLAPLVFSEVLWRGGWMYLVQGSSHSPRMQPT